LGHFITTELTAKLITAKENTANKDESELQ